MSNAPNPWDALSRVDRYIRESERRIAARMCLIEEMRRRGCESRRAERHLQSMQAMLEAWHLHRDQTLREAARESADLQRSAKRAARARHVRREAEPQRL